MEDKNKSKEQLIKELVDLRKELSDLKRSRMLSEARGKLDQLASDIVEKSFHAIWACRDGSKNYEILFWNQGAEKIYNTPREKAVGVNFVETFVNDLEKRTSAAQIDEIIHDGRIFKNFLAIDHTPGGEDRLMLLDNFRIWDQVEGEYVQVEMALHVTESELLNSSDNLEAIRGIESKLNLLEEQKEEVEKTQPLIADRQELITRRNIAIDLVHSIRNFAGPIKTWVNLIRERLFAQDPRDEQINFYLEKIERETNRLLDESEQIGLFDPEMKRVDLRFIIEPMKSSVKYQYPEITFRLHSPEYPLMVFASPSRLSVAIWNVIFNSVEALVESGKGSFIDINIQGKLEQSKKFAEVIISDDGPGIPNEIKDKIFDLGYSTKKGEGLSGYGLWRSRDIIKNLVDGEITFTSEVNKGTKFTILIPTVE